jgi:hypothetical protein
MSREQEHKAGLLEVRTATRKHETSVMPLVIENLDVIDVAPLQRPETRAMIEPLMTDDDEEDDGEEGDLVEGVPEGGITSTLALLAWLGAPLVALWTGSVLIPTLLAGIVGAPSLPLVALGAAFVISVVWFVSETIRFIRKSLEGHRNRRKNKKAKKSRR